MRCLEEPQLHVLVADRDEWVELHLQRTFFDSLDKLLLRGPRFSHQRNGGAEVGHQDVLLTH